MSSFLEVQAKQARRDWSAAEIKKEFGEHLAEAWTLGQAVRLSVTDNEITGSTGEGVFINGPFDGVYRLTDRTDTSVSLLREGPLDEVQAYGIAYLANTAWLSVPYLVASVGSSKRLMAFRNGLHSAADLIPHFAAQRGISLFAAYDIARDICEQLDMPRGIDLRYQLQERKWDDEPANAAANIHQQLMAVGCPGWDVEEAESVLRGGPDARAALARLEAEQGIDVGRMRAAITYVPDDLSHEDLQTLCEGHELAVRRGLGEEECSPDGLPQWEWVSSDGSKVSNLYFASEREAIVAALEEHLLPQWFEGAFRDQDFSDFLHAALPGSANRP